jgi:hypothetical protein
MRRLRARRRAQKEQVQATGPSKSLDYRAALFGHPNYRQLTLTPRRIVDLLINEHAWHFGTRAELTLTYDCIVSAGISRRLIKPSLRKLFATRPFRPPRPQAMRTKSSASSGTGWFSSTVRRPRA